MFDQKRSIIMHKFSALLLALLLSVSGAGIAQAGTLTVANQTVKNGSTVVATGKGSLTLTKKTNNTSYSTNIRHTVKVKPSGNNRGTFTELQGSFKWKDSIGTVRTVAASKKSAVHTPKKLYTDALSTSTSRFSSKDYGHAAYVKLCMDKKLAPDPCSAGAYNRK